MAKMDQNGSKWTILGTRQAVVSGHFGVGAEFGARAGKMGPF